VGRRVGDEGSLRKRVGDEEHAGRKTREKAPGRE
jgi:hypothetical protein